MQTTQMTNNYPTKTNNCSNKKNQTLTETTTPKEQQQYTKQHMQTHNRTNNNKYQTSTHKPTHKRHKQQTKQHIQSTQGHKQRHKD